MTEQKAMEDLVKTSGELIKQICDLLEPHTTLIRSSVVGPLMALEMSGLAGQMPEDKAEIFVEDSFKKLRKLVDELTESKRQELKEVGR